jgi:hypothetical protein
LEVFALKALKQFYADSVAPMITNNNYEGEVKDKSTKLNVLTIKKVALKTYSGSNLTPDDLEESNCQLTTDQQRAFYYKIKTTDKLKSYLKNPEGTVLEQVLNEHKEEVDAFVLGFYSDAAAGSNYGTDYTTGTVAVTATTGAVVGSGTTFTAGMVGKSFKAAGQSKFYRVKTFTDATNIVIEDDSDDETSAYTGGAITAGATYVIQAVSAIQVTDATVYNVFTKMKTMLNKKKIPAKGRFAVVNSDIAEVLLNSTKLTQAVESQVDQTIRNGKIGRVAGFDVYESEQCAGDGVTGVHCLFGHPLGITFAEALTENEIEEQLIGNFGKAHKGLWVYGAKVADVNRSALAHAWLKL